MTLVPVFLSYVLSFVYLGIYWNNHHHMLVLTEQVNGAILWANLHLLFWLSLVPFTTGWMGENDFAAVRRPPCTAWTCCWPRSPTSSCRRRSSRKRGPTPGSRPRWAAT